MSSLHLFVALIGAFLQPAAEGPPAIEPSPVTVTGKIVTLRKNFGSAGEGVAYFIKLADQPAAGRDSIPLILGNPEQMDRLETAVTSHATVRIIGKWIDVNGHDFILIDSITTVVDFDI